MSNNNIFEKPTFVLLVAGVGFFILSFVVMGLGPWLTLKRETMPTKWQSNPYYDKEGNKNAIGRGRDIYIKEGCWHCHSQFVRPVAGEPFRYGPPSKAWESMYDVPQTFGTRRIGPDLSREAGRRSDDWHYAHLYNPRYTVPLSIMPKYPWLFKENKGVIKPKQEAKDLVAYLQFLGKSFEKEIKDVVYPKYFKVAGAPNKTNINFNVGRKLFQEQCIGCHGFKGDGKGPGAKFLTPKPADLVNRYVSPSEVYAILSRGVYGSAMPSFREMPEKDLWALSFYVAELGIEAKKKGLADKNNTLIEQGKDIYNIYCMSCHGKGGGGDGPGALALNPRPKDFTRRVFKKEYFYKIVKNGVKGTAMPPFAVLKDDDLNALFSYVTSLYEEKL